MSFAVTPFTKAAITFNEVYKTNKPSHLMPQHLRENTLSRAEAEQLVAGLAAVAPHNALDFTRYDHNGLKIRGYGSRVAENPRITRFGKWNHHFAADEFEGAMPDKSQGVGDLYLPFADVVSVPSGMPGTAVHELGHAIDFNAFPKDKAYRRGLAAVYRNYAPTLWTEHAAWRKGNKALLDAFAKNHVPANLALKALISAKGAKKLGLGSYWGGAIGGAAGLGAGVASLIGLNELARRNNRDIYVPGRAIAALVGGITMLGAMGGMGVGTLLARNPYKREKAIRILANRYAQEHGISREAATQYVESQLNNVIKATAKTPLKKAANFNLQHALVGAGLGGGAGALTSKSARCWSGYEPVPGKAPYSEGSCRPVQRKAKAKKPAAEKAAALTRLQLLLTKHAEGGAWTRAEGKSESGGLNAKGRASLKAQGQNIKPPVTESNPTGERADRKSSFCARMGGMKKKLTSKETANDPDSRINKALRKWKC